ncbi:hypothetical protein MD484_g3707, partial [Candolleomyces efflorescens]
MYSVNGYGALVHNPHSSLTSLPHPGDPNDSTGAQEVPALAILLIDGDGCIFHQRDIRMGHKGGMKVAQELSSFISDQDPVMDNPVREEVGFKGS